MRNSFGQNPHLVRSKPTGISVKTHPPGFGARAAILSRQDFPFVKTLDRLTMALCGDPGGMKINHAGLE